jgi:CubicO group peptidase (beta-lactamase class C family)
MDEHQLRTKVADLLNRWPSAGLAVAVIRDGDLAWFHGHGVADGMSNVPVTEDTVFRVGSVTKTFTAVAVMQLWEQGLVDLDAAANDYLRAFQLAPMRAGIGSPTVRHLLTHTAGVGYWRRLSDLLRPGVGSGDVPGPPASLAAYYRKGLPVEVEPGTKWAYSNHGFAALGQIVEDVTGQPYASYVREHILDPLGMVHSDLVRSERVSALLATGYLLGRRGLKPVVYDGELPLAAAGGLYASTRDLARYTAALLGGGEHELGRVLKPETVELLFAPHHQPDARVPGFGLGFELGEEGGHRTVAHTGVVSGFLSAITLAPDDGVGVVVLANTGRLDARGAPEPLAAALLRQVLNLPDDAIRTDVPPRPEVWGDLCGWYGMAPGPVTNLFNRVVFGAGVEVVVRGGGLLLRPLSVIPAVRAGFALHPDDTNDPYVFRVDCAEIGKGTFRVAFRHGADSGTIELEGLGMSLRKRPDARNPRRLAGGAAAAGAAVLAARRYRGTRGGGER